MSAGHSWQHNASHRCVFSTLGASLIPHWPGSVPLQNRAGLTGLLWTAVAFASAVVCHSGKTAAGFRFTFTTEETCLRLKPAQEISNHHHKPESMNTLIRVLRIKDTGEKTVSLRRAEGENRSAAYDRQRKGTLHSLPPDHKYELIVLSS